MGAAIRAFRCELEVGPGGRQHRFRMDPDLRHGDSDEEPYGDAFQRESPLSGTRPFSRRCDAIRIRLAFSQHFEEPCGHRSFAGQ